MVVFVSVTFVLLVLAAAGGVAAAYGIAIRWYYSTAFRVTVDRGRTRIWARPEQALTLNLRLENRSHRPARTEQISLWLPKQFRVVSVKAGASEEAQPELVGHTIDGTVESFVIQSRASWQRKDGEDCAVRVVTPADLGRYRLYMMFELSGEPPYYGYLFINVTAR